ncbi:MAG: DUF2062 domain-containing protein [Rhizobiaceae bacterium]|nr:DUF2062 domain-containing protein [Rhizobiaceae bacterium]
MLFRRRQKPTVWGRLRTVFWPSRSWQRSLLYFKKRVLRLHATPHAIAAGFAAGVFASFTPFVGFHFLLAFAISYLIAGNMASAVLGCMVGNPLTFPAIWAATYEVGRAMLHSEAIDGQAPTGLAHALMHMELSAIWTPILKPMLVGSLPLGIPAAIVGYAVVFAAARSFQHRRTETLRQTAERRAATAGRHGAGESSALEIGKSS